jgi:hypothetical protein
VLYNKHLYTYDPIEKGNTMFIFGFFLACGEKHGDTATFVQNGADLDIFARQITGSFNSALQAEENPAYYPVSLQTCPVEIPTLGTHVLYVEQAMMTSLDAPYRQRVYQLEQLDSNTVASHIYEIENPAMITGLCAREDRNIDVEALQHKDGCSVILSWNGEGFAGQTDIGTCQSSLNGASYATSKVVTTEISIESWDQGWDNENNQVWGATEGPYVFRRQ